MKCNGCGNENARHIRIGKGFEVCERCGSLDVGGVPDVYCPEGGYFDENLADKTHRKGQFIRDRHHKAAVMRDLGLAEAGSLRNPETGKVTPYFKNPEKRRKYCIDNFGGNG